MRLQKEIVENSVQTEEAQRCQFGENIKESTEEEAQNESKDLHFCRSN